MVSRSRRTIVCLPLRQGMSPLVDQCADRQGILVTADEGGCLDRSLYCLQSIPDMYRQVVTSMSF